jgi:hypothetical protein
VWGRKNAGKFVIFANSNDDIAKLASLDGGRLEHVARHFQDALGGKRSDFVDGILDVNVGTFLLFRQAALYVNLHLKKKILFKKI